MKEDVTYPEEMSEVRCVVTVLLLVCWMSFTQTSEAAIEVVTGKGAVLQDASVSMEELPEEALALAQEDAAQKAGVYVRSYTKVEDFAVSENDIRAVASQVIETDAVSYQDAWTNDGMKELCAIVRCKVDTDFLERMRVEDLKMDVEKYEELKPSYERSLAQKAQLSDDLRFRMLFLKGNRAFNEKHYEAALTCFQEALQLKSDSLAAHNAVGNLYLAKERTADAEQAFSFVIAHDSKNLAGHFGLSKCFAKEGDDRQALIHLNIVCMLNPDFAEGFRWRGIVYQRMGKHALAQKDFEKATMMEKRGTK